MLGWPPNLVFALLMVAAFCCCVPMAMPQTHLVALCSDLGIVPAHGAAMLSLLLGIAFFSRQMWGYISDKIGGLTTVLIGSAWQFCAIIAFSLTQNEAGLFTVSALFGLGFAGIIPAYVLAARELFPAHEAGWRVPTLLGCTGLRHGVGGWFAGLLYDHFGYYARGLRDRVGLQRDQHRHHRLAGYRGAASDLRHGPQSRTGDAMAKLSNVRSAAPDLIATATLTVETRGEGFTDITRDVARFVAEAGAGDGVLLAYMRHTSASLTIQENADPDVRADLVTALRRLAPENAGWVHDTEGPDDMPAHIKAMLTGISLHVPVNGGTLALGTWQGIYLIEHRARPHRREVVLQFVGSRRG